MAYRVVFFETENGNKPVADFIRGLPAKLQVKALDALRILEEEGPALREPYSKALGDGMFELRIKFASDIARVFYFFMVEQRIVVTNGYVKKRQKADRSELARAYRYKAEYEGRQRS